MGGNFIRVSLYYFRNIEYVVHRTRNCYEYFEHVTIVLRIVVVVDANDDRLTHSLIFRVYTFYRIGTVIIERILRVVRSYFGSDDKYCTLTNHVDRSDNLEIR